MQFAHPLHTRGQKHPIIDDHLTLRVGEPHKLTAEGRCGTGLVGLQSLSALIEFYHALRNEATLSCLAGGDAQN
jgi:hypothetical protein